jgi:phosphoribosylglycinamide formyltransferase-1
MLRQAKIAVMVSGGGTNLQALIDAEREGVIKSGKISLVLSNKADAYALERARLAGIDTAIVEKKSFASREDFESSIIEILDEREIDVIVLAGFMVILSERFTSHFKDRIINVHPSLIPSFCGEGFYGLRVHEAALAYGVKVSGATVHLVNEIPDGGKIIMQKAVAVLDNDTPETLQRRIMEEAEWKILPLSCEKICSEIIEIKEK